MNTRPCDPEAWAYYRDAGVRASEREWARPPFAWEGGAGARGSAELDWEFNETRPRACRPVRATWRTWL